MKVVHRDPRLGAIKLVPEVLDDLYHLAHLIRGGDLVRAVTFRTADIDDDVERRGKVEKRKMTLTLRVESVEFHDFSDRLRVHGPIVEGPQDVGLHHTFNIEADGRSDFTITKPGGWPRHALDRLAQAEAEAKTPILFVLAIEEGEATLAEVRQRGIREVSTLTMGGQGKMYDQKGGTGFLEAAAERVVSVRDPGAPLIVVGPGWTRERFLEHLKKNHPAHGNGLFTDGTGQAGMVGVHEAIKRGALVRVVKDHALTREAALYDRLLAEIAKSDGLATYGPAETKAALALGAGELLLVTDRLVREGSVDELLDLAEETRTEVHVLAETHDPGRGLRGLGGIAALLRFAVPS